MSGRFRTTGRHRRSGRCLRCGQEPRVDGAVLFDVLELALVGTDRGEFDGAGRAGGVGVGVDRAVVADEAPS